MKAIEGSLICQVLKDGTFFGGDYDARLGPLTDWLHRGTYENARILDLGSNAGHFPIEFVRAGASHVTAVEGRPEFRTQWEKIRDHLPGIDPSKITWHTSDVREWPATNDYDIISCLGLVYHVKGIWPHLRRFTTSRVNYIVIESQLWDERQDVEEKQDKDRTVAITTEEIEQHTDDTMEKVLRDTWPEFRVSKIWVLAAGPYNIPERSMSGYIRGLWLLTR